MKNKLIVLGDLQPYADSLLWYYHRSWTERDLPGSANLSGGGARVFDALASHDLHQSMRSNRHRRACHREQLIGFTLSRLPQETRKQLEASFTSYGAGRASYSLLEAASWRGACLIPLMLSALTCSKKRHNSNPHHSPIQALEALAHAQNLEPLVQEAQAALVELVATYALEVDKILCHLDKNADRVTANTYRKAFEHSEH